MKNAQFNFRFPLVVFALFLVLLSCSKDQLPENEDIMVADLKSAQDSTIIDGHYIVLLSREPAVKNARAAAVLEDLKKEVAQKGLGKIKRTYKNALTGFAAELSDTQVEKLRKDPRVLSIEPDGWIYPTTEVNVQEYVTWGIDRIDQREGILDRAYSYSSTGKGVTAYIFDSGIRYSHGEFEGRATLGYDFVLDDDPENTDPSQNPGEDCMGHGTHVAGTVGGKLMGVAKDVKLVSVRVFGCSGATPRSRYITALEWVMLNAVHPAVVNMSLGFTNDPENQTATDLAIENAIQAGIHFVVSAGNSDGNSCNFSPARVPGVLTVGASDFNNQRAYFSNYGDCVDLYAPGVNITSASYMDDTSYFNLNGTSMSAPHVTGLLALYLENFPEASPQEVHTAIITNSTQNAVSNVLSGTNNLAYSHFEAVTFMPPPPPDLNLRITGERIKGTNYANLTWNSTEARFIKIYQDGIAHFTEHFNDGEQLINLRDKERNVTYMIKICEVGYENCSEEVAVVFGDGGDGTTNTAPTADFIYSANLLSVQFTDQSTDSDGVIASWSWNFGEGNTSSSQNPVHNYSAAGTYNVSLTVTDDLGASNELSKSITVGTVEPEPEGIILTANGYKVKGSWTTDLSWESSGAVDIYRNGEIIATKNTGTYTDATNIKGGGSLIYKVCTPGGVTDCSAEVIVNF